MHEATAVPINYHQLKVTSKIHNITGNQKDVAVRERRDFIEPTTFYLLVFLF
jgi:hypothetical protein